MIRQVRASFQPALWFAGGFAGVILAIVFLVVLATTLQSCADSASTAATLQKEEDRRSADVCSKAGGIIIRSGWTSAIVDCKIIGR